MKNMLLLGIAISLSGALFAQKSPGPDSAFTDYIQQIPGSTVSFKMVAIAGGTFQMGSATAEKGRHEDEGPSRAVTVDSFWMEEHEVTFDEYIQYQNRSMDNEPIPDAITRPSPPYLDFSLGMGKTGGYPANSMSQHGALMYCKWLYEKTGIFYRLPTEAEWEYACRAGQNTPYFFGTDSSGLSDYAWYKANSDNKYRKVKQRQPNPWGLYDMLGNVAEWTLDQYVADYFEQLDEPADNPSIPVSAKYPVTLKGGHYQSTADALRSAARLPSQEKWNARDPQIPKSLWWIADAPFVGFRIVRPYPQPDQQAIDQFFEQALGSSE